MDLHLGWALSWENGHLEAWGRFLDVLSRLAWAPGPPGFRFHMLCPSVVETVPIPTLGSLYLLHCTLTSVSRWRYRQVNALGGGHEDVSVIIGSLQHRCQIQCQILSLNWYSITYNTCISFCIFKLSADDSQYMDTIQMLHSFMPYHKYDIMTRCYLYVFKTCKSNMGEWCSSCTLERLRL